MSDSRGSYRWKRLAEAEKAMAHGRPCPVCGEIMLHEVPGAPKLQLDHRIPVALGGSDDPSNLRVIHASCNQSAGGRIGGQRQAAKVAALQAEVLALRAELRRHQGT